MPISSTIKSVVKGTTGPIQRDEAAKHVSKADIEQQTETAEMNENFIKGVAGGFRPGVPVSKGAKKSDEMKIGVAALGVTTTKATARWTQQQIDAEAGVPNAQGQVAIAAIMRLNRKGEK